MKILTLVLSMFISTFANAASPRIPDITCLNAGGFYGNVAIRQIGLEVDVIAQQGYAYELSEKLGAPKGEEAHRLELRFAPYQCKAGAKNALRCQGTVPTIAEAYGKNPSLTAYDAELVVAPVDAGHDITISLQVPGSDRKASATVRFDECEIR